MANEHFHSGDTTSLVNAHLLAESVSHALCRMHDGVARGIGAVTEAMADIGETAAKVTLAKVIPGRVKIVLRPGAVGIAGGKR